MKVGDIFFTSAGRGRIIECKIITVSDDGQSYTFSREAVIEKNRRYLLGGSTMEDRRDHWK